jgi:hypothetical protein
MSVDNILAIETPDEFDRVALEVFRRQAVECAPYRDYLDAVGIDPCGVTRVSEIPFLPIEFFKTHRVYCGANEPEAVFTSSSTGGGGESRHFVAHLTDYDAVYTRGFEIFYGSPGRYAIFALLPSYLEREGSSLVRMAGGLIAAGRAAGRGGGFYLRNHARMLADMAADGGPKIVLGVSYALLDLAGEMTAGDERGGERDDEIGDERGGDKGDKGVNGDKGGPKLPPETIIMETGGMKGRRAEMSKAQMHSVLRAAFGVPSIHSEYGMAELTSQAYSAGEGVFRTPPWMRVAVRDLVDPFDVRGEGRGAINIIDLANLHSCAFIATQDLGRVVPDGSFTLDGRVARSDIRGCNLLIQ